MKKFTTIILSLIMIISAMCTFTYAEGEQPANANQPQNANAKIGQVTGLKTISSYKSIALEWDATPNAVKYEVYKDGAHCAYVNANNYYDKSAGIDKEHTYTVRAFDAANNAGAFSEAMTDMSVKQMYIRITFNQSKKLTSHDKKKKSRKFKAGQKVDAFGFGGGKYKFYYEGNLFFVSYMRVKKPKAYYTKEFNYTNQEAEYFINQAGVKSKTKWLVWVNLYTQHAYVFQGSKGNWKVFDDWEVSSGIASSPTPTGLGKKIHNKISSRHGLGPWTSFQSLNSFHGKRKSWKLGAPASHGCVRCPTKKSKWMYKTLPMKTRVSIY